MDKKYRRDTLVPLLLKFKQYYIDYAKLNNHKVKINKTKELIKEVLRKNSKPYVAFSTGKDSLCLFHLVYSINPNIDIMFHDSGVELPESYIQIEKFKKNWGINLYIVKSPISVLDKYKEKNGIFIGACEDIAFKEAMGKPIKEFAKKGQYDVAFIGLRKQESKRRRLMLYKNGNYFYCKSYKINECFPLADWKKEDVFAYIFTHYPLENLIHPAYYKDRLVKDPGDIRISWYCDPTAATYGQFLWLKMYYPDIYIKLSNKFPEINTYI